MSINDFTIDSLSISTLHDCKSKTSFCWKYFGSLVHEENRKRSNIKEDQIFSQGPLACRSRLLTKTSAPSVSPIWIDDQPQPLPRSVRQYLHGWVRAEELATSRWEAEVVVNEESNLKMTISDMQVSHAQVLLRSSFCREVLSACFVLERIETVSVEHQNDHFTFAYGPEGWRAKYHVYSPGMKHGGGAQHKPMLSKNGCYMVRLYYLGAWRCVWVSDQVPVDTSGAPLLPFSPLMSNQNLKKGPMITSHYVQLWPLLLCKALLKLAAPDMTADEEDQVDMEDEQMPELDLLHSLTGGLNTVHWVSDFKDRDAIWEFLQAEVHHFMWDDDNETMASTVKSTVKKPPSTKKGPNKETLGKQSIVTALIINTEGYPIYTLPGITPSHEQALVIFMIRDVPLRKPLPEPVIPLWKTYRWLDWAKNHGLYDSYECPRTRFLKVNGLMKVSYAPHLHNITSTQSLTMVFREEHEKKDIKKREKDAKDVPSNSEIMRAKEEMKEWVLFSSLCSVLRAITILYFPSLFEFASCGSCPPPRAPGKPGVYKQVDIMAPKSAPLYISIDSSEIINLKMSLSVLHPRVLTYSGVAITDFIEKGYLLLEPFEWFKDTDLPLASAYVDTRGYNSVEVKLRPGRHYFRLWVHSQLHWHAALITDANILLGTRDVIIGASVKECVWTSRFLTSLGNSFLNWIRIPRTTGRHVALTDRDFFASYLPDFEWDRNIAGYPKCWIHWMFRQAVQSCLEKNLANPEYSVACNTLRRYFMDPDFGFPPKPKLVHDLRHLVDSDICDCKAPEIEEQEGEAEVEGEGAEDEATNHGTEESEPEGEQPPIVSKETMKLLLKPLLPGATSNLCEFSTETVPCQVLREERDKELTKHEAATILQAHWRGCFARKVLNNHTPITPDVQKLIMDNVFGHLEVLSQLMNEFFFLFPGAKHAYSISSGLSGAMGLQQHSGVSIISPTCKWIPYFQGVFYCHYPVKVHFDVHSNLQYSTISIFDNDNGRQKPQAYNAHITFDFEPNTFGYTVIGHGSINKEFGYSTEAQWQLSILSSVENMFHICDNPDTETCTIMPLLSCTKLHLDEFFVPNRRKILGGIQIACTKIEAVCFRAEASSPGLEIEAVLRSTTMDGEVEELGRCHGTGEIFWPYIRLTPHTNVLLHKKSVSHGLLSIGAHSRSTHAIAASKINKKKSTSANASTRKLDDVSVSPFESPGLKPAPVGPKIYTIQVTAPNGWALTLDQWQRVVSTQNAIEAFKMRQAHTVKSTKGKDKASSAKDKKEKEKAADKENEDKPLFEVVTPLPGDAFTVLECSTTLWGGAVAKRDDDRDILFALERKAWAAKEYDRDFRGAAIRQEFISEFLVPEAIPSSPVTFESGLNEEEAEEEPKVDSKVQFTSPVTESNAVDPELEPEEECLYYEMPEVLKHKFESLYFIPLCTKAMQQEESVLVTADMLEAAKKERQMHLDAALNRMHLMQSYNDRYVLGRQGRRARLLEKLFVDSEWKDSVAEALQRRDDAIAAEILERQQSAARKKIEAKQPVKPNYTKSPPQAGRKK